MGPWMRERNMDEPIGKSAWYKLEAFSPAAVHADHGKCEAPRHVGHGIDAVYVWVVVIGNDHVIQGMCAECMDKAAEKIGTTAERGVHAWPSQKSGN